MLTVSYHRKTIDKLDTTYINHHFDKCIINILEDQNNVYHANELIFNNCIFNYDFEKDECDDPTFIVDKLVFMNCVHPLPYDITACFDMDTLIIDRCVLSESNEVIKTKNRLSNLTITNSIVNSLLDIEENYYLHQLNNITFMNNVLSNYTSCVYMIFADHVNIDSNTYDMILDNVYQCTNIYVDSLAKNLIVDDEDKTEEINNIISPFIAKI